MDTPTMTGVYTGGPPTGLGPDDNWEPLDKDRTLEAVEWFEQELATSEDADYLIVAGHYMILEALGWYDLVSFQQERFLFSILWKPKLYLGFERPPSR